MKLINTIGEYRLKRAAHKGGKVAFIPTMGALHAGHRSLFRIARERVGEEGLVVVSIFVNPTQFDKKADLTSYPRTLDEDLEQCEAEGVDLVFFPEAGEVYAPDVSIMITESLLSNTLCGATRPGHFNGVCTVVLKLYNIVQPDLMVFGKKDFQQIAIIRRMMRDLNVPVEILGGATVREESGLALSSRNARLSETEYGEAPLIFSTLCEMRDLLASGELDTESLNSFLAERLKGLSSETRIDYIQLVDAQTLQPITERERGKCTLAVAVFFGSVRLIDHISVDL